MKNIPSAIKSLNRFDTLLAQIEQGAQLPSLGLNRAARLPVLVTLFQALGRPILFLTQKTDHALALIDELSLWTPDSDCLYFPEPTSLFYEDVEWGNNTRRERLHALTTLAAGMIPGAPKPETAPIIVAPARAVMTRTMPRRKFVKATRSLKAGQRINLVELAGNWVEAGYEATATVIMPGQFARRGGILDIWPAAADRPTRLDFFDDELESLRYFDPATQRSAGLQSKLLIPPAREFLVPEEARQQGVPYSEFHIPQFHTEVSSILDYLPKKTLVLVDDWGAFTETVNELEEQAVLLYKDYLAEGEIAKDTPIPYLTIAEIGDSLARYQSLELGPIGYAEAADIAHAFTPGQRFGGRVNQVIEHTNKLLDRGDEVVIVSRQAARLQELWQASLHDPDAAPPRFVQGALGEGWIFTSSGGTRLHLMTDGEIFGWKRPQPRQRQRLVAEAPEANYIEFQLDDLVVHVDHGIGRYKGLVKRQLGETEQEYLCVEYAKGDQLYVPVHQADRLSRYIGARGHNPTVSKLGGVEWRATKARVKHAVQQVAEDLLELYAKRQIAKGHAFEGDTQWQNELEASFPYVETVDQLRVLSEVKLDMESDRPMDRLICGDVGFGKTEVALRAAFKAVMGGKQVAILVPTTVLAQQHYYTFLQRLAAFPVKVEMLSRFRTQAQQREILLNLAKGKVDIVIGTHRLVQPDIQFKDLGLLIIDEEQRFGVTHKEYLKTMRTEVDVLTLTATPIPRTMYMALTGVRDISTINTPPEERLPVVTHIGPFAEKVIRQAILRELERGGQIFFVHNRVQTILSMKARIQKIVPEIRILVAHGQMKEKELAKRMREFSSGEVDLLLSTTIIESGLDIPNANTLIVDRADTFGLAQLYQLRGRVGRGAQRAYAYFFKHQSRGMTDEGRMRLETIAENTQLGAGFSIAMRDLEIRGAGDFLGTRQHGVIASVGLNLYTRLLSQAVNEIKESGGIQKGKLPVSVALYHPMINIDLPLSMTIPESYVPEREMRLRLYRRLADIHTFDAIDALEEEFADRFGAPPEMVTNIFYQLRVKVLAEQTKLSSISAEGEQMVFRFPVLPENAPPRKYPRFSQRVRTGKNALWLPMGKTWREDLLQVLDAFVTG